MRKAEFNKPILFIALFPLIPWLLQLLPKVLVDAGLIAPNMHEVIDITSGKVFVTEVPVNWINQLLGWLPGPIVALVLIGLSVFPILFLCFKKWPEQSNEVLRDS